MSETENRVFTAEELEKLRGYWRRLGRKDLRDGFGSFEDFLSWSKKNGYTDGMWLTAIDPARPLGPDNGQWRYPDMHPEQTEKAPPTSHPCVNCSRDYYCTEICPLRAKWWDVQMARIREVLSR